MRRKDEPFITMMSVEEDSIYHTRLEAGAESLEEAAMDSDEEQELETKREGGVTKRQYQAVRNPESITEQTTLTPSTTLIVLASLARRCSMRSGTFARRRRCEKNRRRRWSKNF